MNNSNILCLMYHDVYVSQKSESGFSSYSADIYKIGVEDFEEQVKRIVYLLEDNKSINSEVRFTFDDGGSSFLYKIAPILEKYSIKGYFFISTKYIGKDGFLTESEIQELDARGHIIGGHSHAHQQMMNTWSLDLLEEDWAKCQRKLTNIIGHSIEYCSLPCGFLSDDMLEILIKLGFLEIYTSIPTCDVKKYCGANLYGRYGVKDDMSNNYILSIVKSPIVRLKIKLKKSVLNLAKNIFGKQYLKIREILIGLMHK